MTIPYSYAINAFAYSDTGRIRRTNEDSFVIADLTRAKAIDHNGVLQFESGRKGALFAVADGMGGAAAGEMASRLSLESIYDQLLQNSEFLPAADNDSLEQILIDAVGTANRVVFDEGRNDDELAGMGTTLTAVLEIRGRLFIGQVGDSRAYLISDRNIFQLTRDQSLVGQRVSNGELTEAQARKHPARNILLQALGVGPTVELCITKIAVREGDMILLCSDGLHSQMSAEEINEIVLDSANEQDACVELVNLANDRGGPDNITVVLIRFL
jgi:PPM family protein phosphatase